MKMTTAMSNNGFVVAGKAAGKGLHFGAAAARKAADILDSIGDRCDKFAADHSRKAAPVQEIAQPKTAENVHGTFRGTMDNSSSGAWASSSSNSTFFVFDGESAFIRCTNWLESQCLFVLEDKVLQTVRNIVEGTDDVPRQFATDGKSVVIRTWKGLCMKVQ